MRLRQAVAEDAVEIVRWFPTHEEAVLWGGPDIPDPPTVGWLAGQFGDATRQYYVLLDAEGRVCGTYSLRPIPEERRLHLGRFGIAPDLRGRGLGRLMIAEAVRMAYAGGAEKLTLYVYDRNLAARRLYERLGFVPSPTGSRREFPNEAMVAMELAVV